VNKRFSYITRTGLVVVSAVFLTQEGNEEVWRQIAWLKKEEAGEADGPRASRPNFHCILETAGYYEREMFLPLFLILPYFRLPYTSSSCFLHPLLVSLYAS